MMRRSRGNGAIGWRPCIATLRAARQRWTRARANVVAGTAANNPPDRLTGWTHGFKNLVVQIPWLGSTEVDPVMRPAGQAGPRRLSPSPPSGPVLRLLKRLVPRSG